jgi:hypothetical protein
MRGQATLDAQVVEVRVNHNGMIISAVCP